MSISDFTFKYCSRSACIYNNKCSLADHPVLIIQYHCTVPRIPSPNLKTLSSTNTHTQKRGIALHHLLISLFPPCNYTMCRKHLFLGLVENQAGHIWWACRRRGPHVALSVSQLWTAGVGIDIVKSDTFFSFLSCCTCCWRCFKRLYHIWMWGNWATMLSRKKAKEDTRLVHLWGRDNLRFLPKWAVKLHDLNYYIFLKSAILKLFVGNHKVNSTHPHKSKFV